MEIRRPVEASCDDVFAVLADGWLYASWVVGASRIRSVDDAWPEVGARLHHSIGSWPFLINDVTEVIVCEPGRRLTMAARGWPLGEADVYLELQDEGRGRCTISMREDAAGGPSRLIPYPVRQVALAPRNAESLRRLAYLAEGRR